MFGTVGKVTDLAIIWRNQNVYTFIILILWVYKTPHIYMLLEIAVGTSFVAEAVGTGLLNYH